MHVFVLLGNPMDFYAFPRLPEIETGEERDCVIYYLQFEFTQREGITGAVGNVEKMLKPLKIRSFEVRSARRCKEGAGEDVGGSRPIVVEAALH